MPRKLPLTLSLALAVTLAIPAQTVPAADVKPVEIAKLLADREAAIRQGEAAKAKLLDTIEAENPLPLLIQLFEVSAWRRSLDVAQIAGEADFRDHISRGDLAAAKMIAESLDKNESARAAAAAQERKQLLQYLTSQPGYEAKRAAAEQAAKAIEETIGPARNEAAKLRSMLDELRRMERAEQLLDDFTHTTTPAPAPPVPQQSKHRAPNGGGK